MAWSCITGEGAKDCIIAHWLPALDGRMERVGGRAPCPLCGSKRPLSVQVKGGRVVWNHHCQCAEQAVGEAIAAAVACYSHAAKRTRKPAPDLEEIKALALDRNVTVNALRLGALEALGVSTGEAEELLKLPRRTLGDARRILAESRRSRGRRLLASITDRTESEVARSRRK